MTNLTPELLEQMQKMLEKENKPVKGIAKFITLLMLIIVFIVGIIGSFVWANFDMEKFVQFLPVFGIMYVPLILSIGSASIVKKIKEDKK